MASENDEGQMLLHQVGYETPEADDSLVEGVDPTIDGYFHGESEIASDKGAGIDLNLMSALKEQCLEKLKSISNVPLSAIQDIENLLKLYHEGITEERNKQSDDKCWWKIQDVMMLPEISYAYTSQAMNEKEPKVDESALLREVDDANTKIQQLSLEKDVLHKKVKEMEKVFAEMGEAKNVEDPDVVIRNYIKEIGSLKHELGAMDRRLSASQAETRNLAIKLDNKTKECNELDKNMKMTQEDAMKLEKRRSILETETNKTLHTVSEMNKTLNKECEKLKKSAERLSIVDEENRDLKKAVSSFDRQHRIMKTHIQKLQDRLEVLAKSAFETQMENSKLKDIQLKIALKEQTRSLDLSKVEDKWLRRIEAFNRMWVKDKEEAKKLTDKLHSKIKEAENYESKNLELKKIVNELEKEKAISNEKIYKLTGVISEREKDCALKSVSIDQLEKENGKLKNLIKDQSKEIVELQRITSIAHKNMKKIENENEVRTAELERTVRQLLEYHQEILKKEKEIKEVVIDYNNVLLEKKTLRSRLLQSKGLQRERESKIRYFDAVVNHDKQQLDRNTDLIRKLQYRVQRLQYDYNKLKVAFKQQKFGIRNLLKDIYSKQKEKGNLDKLIQKGEIIRIAVIKDAERLRQDVSILRTVIQRRNAEISLVYEKYDMMNSIIVDRKNELKRRLMEIHLLKTEVLRLRSENLMLKKSLENSGNLQKEIYYLQKDLTIAKQRYTALEEQMENPINVHRWRILKGKDPERNKLIEENQSLKRKMLLIEKKYKELKEKFDNTEKDFIAYREKSEKYAEKEVYIMKFQEAQRLIRDKNGEIQRLSVTVRTYQYSVHELEKELEKKKHLAEDFMKKYYDLKRFLDKEFINQMDDVLDEKKICCKTC